MRTVVVLATVVALIDQAVKEVALRSLVPGTPVHLLGGVCALRLGFNPGLAFGLLADLHPEFRWVVAAVSVLALFILARVAYRVLPTGGRNARVGLGLVFGGAAGNLIDRARHGAVVDFFDVYWRQYHWPAFNTADSAIAIGVVLLALTVATPKSGSSGG